MSRYYSYLNNSKAVVESFKGDIPLAVHLKQFFAARNQMGSKDRKEVSAMVYQYYRLGNAVNVPFQERMIVALFLCRQQPSELLQLLKPEWNKQIALPLMEKISFLLPNFAQYIFPFIEDVDHQIEPESFCLSHLVQPDLFIRIRPKHELSVKSKLLEEGISFNEMDDYCLSLPNTTSLDNVLQIDKQVVIQDYASQQIAQFLHQLNNVKSVWDCCAASGGKSILAVDVLGKIDLTLSDVRPTIIANLRKRLNAAGINQHKVFSADITKRVKELNGEKFDLIICDAPCSGSGTWGRTPENLVSIKRESISQYAKLQKAIVHNAIAYLSAKGYFLYITCSVYRAENEEVVDYISTHFPRLKLVKKQLIDGYKTKADTMYAALFKNSGG